MIATILGCGTSTGVPMIGCSCEVCTSGNPKNHRLRCSLWIQFLGPSPRSFLIDTSTDLRQQALRAKIPYLDAVFYTHPHADHIHGIDELRSFNFLQKKPIPVYGNSWTKQDLFIRYPYIFQEHTQEGGGIPQLDFHLVDSRGPHFFVQEVSIVPIALQHGSRESLGYRFGPLAYITDCNDIPPPSMERLRNPPLKVLVLDCVRLKPHPTHFHYEKALEVIVKLNPEQAFLTHMSHDFDYDIWMKKLPKGIALAYDGMQVFLEDYRI